MDEPVSAPADGAHEGSDDEQYYLASDDTQAACPVIDKPQAVHPRMEDVSACSASHCPESRLADSGKPGGSGDMPTSCDGSTDGIADRLDHIRLSDCEDKAEIESASTPVEAVALQEFTDEEKEARRLAAVELKDRGNNLFRQQQYEAAVQAYAEAIKLCPPACSSEVAVMHANRAACFAHLDRHDEAVNDCTEALRLNPQYVKVLLRRAELHEKKQKYEEALDDYKSAVQTPDCPGAAAQQARQAIDRLPALIAKRNEEMKAEMLGKLKDLGNMVLRPFGLSTNNFKMVQDPSTGSYSINFQQGAPPPDS